MRCRYVCSILFLVLGLSSLGAAPAMVRLIATKEGFVLQHNGQPYVVQGFGLSNESGADAVAEIKLTGATSIRTWGVVDPQRTKALLDDAQRLGLTVCFGIWIDHQSDSLSYRDPDTAKRIFAQVVETVLTYRDHPAILMWGIGNEMEGYTAESYRDPAVWLLIEHLAAAVKKIDPNHPTMTTLAEIADPKIPDLNRYCPSIDIVGINSYGGLPTLPARYRAAGGTKPYLVTEFGPRGTWESPLTTWGAPLEPTSTAKAATYRAGYEATVLGDQPGLCLGAYAFLWGHKQETTATWYGMHLRTGERLAAVDTMQELWTGQAPTHRVPRIDALTWRGSDRIAPGKQLPAVLHARSPEGDELQVKWVVRTDTTEIKLGGAAEPEQMVVDAAVIASSLQGATIRGPEEPGAYRLFVTVKDRHGGAATGNLPFLVEAAKK